MRTSARACALALAFLAALAPVAFGQGEETLIERKGPPALEDFETDKNKDGIPDGGWYNARNAKLAEGGVEGLGPHCLRFEERNPGRPARLSRGFGLDGRAVEAIVVGLWVRVDQIQTGERLGEDPGMMIDFLGEGLRQQTRGSLGPWTSRNFGRRWTRVAKRIAVPPGTRDAIISVGLLGATGVLEIDGLTFDLVPVGGKETTNLLVNGDFELGNPDPSHWIVDGGARRSFPGLRSSSSLDLPRSGARATIGLAVPVEPFAGLTVSIAVRAQGLRGSGGASAKFFFLDESDQLLPRLEQGAPVFNWSGSFDWRTDRVLVNVPPGAVRAVLQVEKTDSGGAVHLDDVRVEAAPAPEAAAWVPHHVGDDVSGWSPVPPSPSIEPGSALDASHLLDAPAGKHGFVTVREGRLAFSKGYRARFYGVALLAPTAFLEAEKAEALANRLARSGVNLVRLGDLDTALGPDRSLFDDTRDDTKAFDPVALGRLDHLIAALKKRGIYVALELQSARQFRSGDGVPEPGALPLGGGPAAAFDPAITQLEIKSARALLAHVNPETGLALRDDPALAWVVLAGEVSLFDLIDNASSLPPDYAAGLKNLASKNKGGSGRKFWMTTEIAHWKELADKLREDHLKAPVASVSHWRREAEFGQGLQAPGFDLIEDRLYWTPLPWVAPIRRSVLWSLDGGLVAGAAKKRQADRPYAVGQWAHQTQGAWALPYEGADVMLASSIAAAEDWDALVRRGVFLFPEVWGAGSAGTGGGEDIFQIPEAVNGIPQVYSLWPHAASVMLRGHPTTDEPAPAPQPGPRRTARHKKPVEGLIEGWNPSRGRLLIDTPYTQGLAGWPGGEPATLENLTIETTDPYAVVMASSVGKETIANTRRLLVTAVARVTPTGFRWVDEWRREVADPGRPPLLQEPLAAKIRWRRKGDVKAFALDNAGARVKPVKLTSTEGGFELEIDGTTPTLHWELVVE